MLSRIVLIVASCAFAGAAPLTTAEDLVARLREYLVSYEGKLSSLAARERYEQTLTFTRRGAGDQTGPLPRRKRVLDSDVLFLRLPGDAEWFGVRDTRRVDGRAGVIWLEQVDARRCRRFSIARTSDCA